MPSARIRWQPARVELNSDPEVERASALVRALVKRAHRARTSSVDFFEMVMREETTRARLRAAPHQRVVLQFVADHPLCVLRLPIGYSKTYLMVALTLMKLGQDPTSRGWYVSGTDDQATKPVGAIRDYIESSPELRLVFPDLRPSERSADPWQQGKLTVDRPPGIRDPSVVAVSQGMKVPGARVSWAVIDDILNSENTSSPEQRAKLHKWVALNVFSRLDPKDRQCVVCNTPWVGPSESDPGDLTYQLEAAGWPSLTMSASGDITIKNADDWDCDDIRPAEGSTEPSDPLRLTAHDDPAILAETYDDAPPDPTKDVEGAVPLWPARYNRAALESTRRLYTARQFAQLFECRARSESDDRLQFTWIERGKAEARRLGFFGFSPSLPSTCVAVVTGVDLAVGRKARNDRTSIFTFGILADKRRVPLNIQSGRWSGTEIIRRIIAEHRSYGSIIRVENNAAQDFLLQWARESDVTLPIRPHTTGRNKVHPETGLESILIEIEQGAWLFPSDPGGRCPAELDEFIRALQQHEPGEHTADVLMAAWFAREQARRQGAFSRLAAAGSAGFANFNAR